MEVPGVLKLRRSLLLNTEDDSIGATNTDGGVTLAHSFESVFDLKQMAVGGEDGDCPIVSSHCCLASAPSLSLAPENYREKSQLEQQGTTPPRFFPTSFFFYIIKHYLFSISIWCQRFK